MGPTFNGLHLPLLSAEKHQKDQEEAAMPQQKIIEWISPLNFSPIQQDVLKKRYEGTCLWPLDHENFKKWISKSRQFLLCQEIRE
jgi:hypothetical protein